MYDTTKPYKEEIQKLIQMTWNTRYVVVEDEVIVQKKIIYPEYAHTDGIGTKGEYHWKARTFRQAVLDALAQNMNDLDVKCAEPFALVDHILLPEDDHAAAVEIVRHLSKECIERGIAICGGDTAIHSNLKGLEISIAMIGFVKNRQPNCFSDGDVLVALSSSGLHSNGFTKVRELFGDEMRKEFTRPTHIYHDVVSKVLEKFSVHGMVHVAGGGYTRLKPLLRGTNAVIIGDSFCPHQIFQEIYERGVSDKEMYETFNCGTGFFMGMSEKDAEMFTARLKGKIKANIAGVVVSGTGKVKIQSQFSKKIVVL